MTKLEALRELLKDPMTTEQRQARKTEDERYRQAAARLSGGTVRPLTAVNRPASNEGAFVEVTMWVPREEVLVPIPPIRREIV